METAVIPGEPAHVLIDEAKLRHASLLVMSNHGRSGLGRWLYGIVAAAKATGAVIIVMATHARTGLGRAILGSVALDVLRHGTQPVLLVRPTWESVVESSEAVTAQ